MIIFSKIKLSTYRFIEREFICLKTNKFASKINTHLKGHFREQNIFLLGQRTCITFVKFCAFCEFRASIGEKGS